MEICSTGGTHNHVGGDQINVNNHCHAPSASSSNQLTPLRPFIEAPVDLLLIHFAGRTEELLRIKETSDADCGDVPIRCHLRHAWNWQIAVGAILRKIGGETHYSGHTILVSNRLAWSNYNTRTTVGFGHEHEPMGMPPVM
jgi:hypothetical protein